jgi:hypothetical protein
MLSKAELGVGDRIELLRALSFHCHVSGEERGRMEASQAYTAQVCGGAGDREGSHDLYYSERKGLVQPRRRGLTRDVGESG